MDKISHSDQPLPAEKFKLRLSQPAYRQADRLAVLCMSGSFDPIHTQHIRAVELSRAVLERAGWAVAGGFLAPSSDDYVQSKLKSDEWPLARRIHLCELATQESDWLSVCPWGEFSSYRLCVAIGEKLRHDCTRALKGRSLTGIEMMSSDAAIRILDKILEEWRAKHVDVRKLWYQGRIVCCVIRPGPKSGGETRYIQNVIVPGAAEIGVELIIIDAARERVSLEGISSTDIRELVARGDWDQLSVRRWLHPQVLSALRHSAHAGLVF